MRNQLLGGLQPRQQFGQLATGQPRGVGDLRTLGGIVPDGTRGCGACLALPDAVIRSASHFFRELVQRGMVAGGNVIPAGDQVADCGYVYLVDFPAQHGHVVLFEFIRIEHFPRPEFTLETDVCGATSHTVALLIVLVLDLGRIDIGLQLLTGDPVGYIAKHSRTELPIVEFEDSEAVERVPHQGTCWVAVTIGAAFSIS
ncbi:hypothetical protein [Nocardia abscessus]|uniref:hypothetical protein n=1 Tax=Nocardia abscessus TaxID=120957 RepID=UPI00245530A9|nr:hypothetical protein [Nocardia abscessus]